jgi:hypothetical protein
MARIAYRSLLTGKKVLVLGGVSRVAGKTFPPGCHRLMGNIYRYVFATMTGKAELPTLSGEQDLVL